MKKISVLFFDLLRAVTLGYAAQDRILPDSQLTPGVILNVATRGGICVPGYSKFVSHVPEREKRQVYQEDNMQPHK